MESVVPTSMALEIQKLQDGGYLVGDGYNRYGDFRSFRFACTTIDEALKFVKSQLEPKAQK